MSQASQPSLSSGNGSMIFAQGASRTTSSRLLAMNREDFINSNTITSALLLQHSLCVAHKSKISYLMIDLIDRGLNMKPASACSKLHFGTVLWNILGGHDADKRLAAERLGINANFLSHVLHGRDRVSQRFLTDKRWRDVLAKYYSENWKQQSAAFEQCVARLRAYPGKCPREPKLKTGLGYVLWLILGGKGMNLGKAAERLNIDQTKLSAIIHGRVRTSRRFVTNKRWRDVLEKYYSESWTQQSAAFEQCVARLRANRGYCPRKPKLKPGSAMFYGSFWAGNGRTWRRPRSGLTSIKPN